MSKSMKDKLYRNAVQKDRCLEHQHHILNYTTQFWETYADQPTFTTLYLTELAHDNINAGYKVDQLFYDFFVDNNEKVSFVKKSLNRKNVRFETLGKICFY
jgi:hypothetical protein